MKKVLLLLLGLSATLAQAQPVPPVQRKGILFGASLGGATTAFRTESGRRSQADVALNWKIGYSLSPRVALLLNGTVAMYDNSTLGRPRKRDFGGVFPSVQYWPVRRLWVLGGAGIGTDAPVFYDLKPENKDERKYYSGLGFVSGLGYEVYQKKTFAIDLQLRVSYSRVALPGESLRGLSTGLLLGFNFY